MTGVVSFWREGPAGERKGNFGFIQDDSVDPGAPGIFVHISSIQGLQPLHKGQKVQFDLGENERSGRVEAINVVPLD
jgi:cold shock CspA family protein